LPGYKKESRRLAIKIDPRPHVSSGNDTVGSASLPPTRAFENDPKILCVTLKKKPGQISRWRPVRSTSVRLIRLMSSPPNSSSLHLQPWENCQLSRDSPDQVRNELNGRLCGRGVRRSAECSLHFNGTAVVAPARRRKIKGLHSQQCESKNKRTSRYRAW
jgi:hypothetical protein